MNDLLQPQIKSSCELALPNGLKELMWDISREVLRAQPQNIYGFIENYLSSLLVTRENLTIAAKVCDETCRTPCHVTLEDKLKNIGLSEQDVITAMTIIMDHFGKKVNERSLLKKIMKKTNIDEALLPDIVKAVRSAFVEQHVYKTIEFETVTEDDDDVKQAARHTLKLYKNTGPSHEEYNQMATKIQATYRAYGVKRKMCTDKLKEMEKEKSLTIKDDYNGDKKVLEREKLRRANNRSSVTTESSTSLAGSYVKLPKYVPYSVHDAHSYESEEPIEKVHSSSDVLGNVTPEAKNIRFKQLKPKEDHENINFDALSIEDDVLEADDESEGTIEEHIESQGDEYMENMNETNEMIESERIHKVHDLGEEHKEYEINELIELERIHEAGGLGEEHKEHEMNESKEIHEADDLGEEHTEDENIETIESEAIHEAGGLGKEHKEHEIIESKEIHEADDMGEEHTEHEINEMIESEGIHEAGGLGEKHKEQEIIESKEIHEADDMGEEYTEEENNETIESEKIHEVHDLSEEHKEHEINGSNKSERIHEAGSFGEEHKEHEMIESEGIHETDDLGEEHEDKNNEMIESERIHEVHDLDEEHKEDEMHEMSGSNENNGITEGFLEELEANDTQNYEAKISNEVTFMTGSTNGDLGIIYECEYCGK